jgi:hypothetical protein
MPPRSVAFLSAHDLFLSATAARLKSASAQIDALTATWQPFNFLPGVPLLPASRVTPAPGNRPVARRAPFPRLSASGNASTPKTDGGKGIRT